MTEEIKQNSEAEEIMENTDSLEEKGEKLENLDKTSDNKPARDEKGRLLPGNSGNPEGRPKGTLSLISILKELLREMIKEKTTGEMKEKARAMMEIYLKKAILDEDKDVIKDIINRIDGMPKGSLQLGVDETIGEVKIEIIRPKEEIIKPKENAEVNT